MLSMASFLVILALFAVGNPRPAPTSVPELESNLEICPSQEPEIPVFNSMYTVWPNQSLCCPPYLRESDEPYCISEEDMEVKCGKENRGIVDEPCFYCKTCAKLIGELCHGPYKAYGRCDEGLECMDGEQIKSNYYDNYAIGVCTTKGGPRTDRGLGQPCGGWKNSVGYCSEGFTCPNKENASAICVPIRELNEPCGGRYGIEGVCQDKRITCTVNEEEFLNGANITGVCLKNACVNDCTLKNIAPVCGSDGNWYINNCARRKINCNLTKNIVKESDDSFCTGEPPSKPTPSPAPTPPPSMTDSSVFTQQEDTQKPTTQQEDVQEPTSVSMQHEDEDSVSTQRENKASISTQHEDAQTTEQENGSKNTDDTQPSTSFP